MTDSDPSMDGVFPLPDSESSTSNDSGCLNTCEDLYDPPTNPADNNNTTSFVKFKFVVKRPPDWTNHLEKVPDEILLNILENLSQKNLARLAQTCRRFNKLAYYRRFWRRVYLCCQKKIRTNVIGYVLSRGATYLAMQVSRVSHPIMDAPMYQSLLSQTIDLTHLDISYAIISTEDINTMLSLLKNLEVLLMEEQQIDNDTCVHIGQNSKIITLGMAMIIGLTAQGILDIVKPCQSLQNLNLSWAVAFDKVVTEITVLDNLVNNISCNLREISLAGSFGLMTRHLEKLILRCPKLRKLDVSDNIHLTPLSGDQFTLLTNLPLVGLYVPRTSLFHALDDNWFEKLVHLEELDVVTFHRIYKKYPNVGYSKKFDSGIARALHKKNPSRTSPCQHFSYVKSLPRFSVTE